MKNLSTEKVIINEAVTGSVKWFSIGREFGFFVPDAGGPDVLLHANTLRNYGRNSITEGTRLEVLIARTSRGMQVVKILNIESPTANFTHWKTSQT